MLQARRIRQSFSRQSAALRKAFAERQKAKQLNSFSLSEKNTIYEINFSLISSKALTLSTSNAADHRPPRLKKEPTIKASARGK